MQVKLSGNKINWPHQCACCGATPPNATYTTSFTKTSGKKVIKEQTKSFELPYCDTCIHHVSKAPGNWGCGTMFLVLITCLVWIPFQLWWDAERRKRAVALMTPTCACVGVAAAYQGWEGTIQEFDFVSETFAKSVIVLNEKKAVDIPYHLHQELQEHAEAAEIPTFQGFTSSKPSQSSKKGRSAHASTAVQADGDIVAAALEKLENLKTPSARRAAVEAALPKLESREAKERLLVSAAKADVEAVLDKVDGLKSDAAKRRNLEAALEQLRKDDVPDELQAREIELLEKALRGLS